MYSFNTGLMWYLFPHFTSYKRPNIQKSKRKDKTQKEGLGEGLRGEERGSSLKGTVCVKRSM